MSRILVPLVLLLAAACTPVDHDPPQTNTGHCTHYGSTTRQLEDVPNCELRTRNTLINGLAPAWPGNKS